MTVFGRDPNPFALSDDEARVFSNLTIAPCPTEKDVQRAILRIADAVGFDSYSMSQYRASHVSEGIPDLKFLHRRRALGLWWETKTYVARQWKRGILELKPLASKQAEFRDRALRNEEAHGWGALPEFYAALLFVGLAFRRGGVIMLRPGGG